MTFLYKQSNMPKMLRFAFAATVLVCVATYFRASSYAQGWELVTSAPYEPAPAPEVQFISKVVRSNQEVRLKMVVFDTQKYRIKIIDQPGDRVRLDAAVMANNCIAGVNGGYFHPGFKPAGLVVSGGKVANSTEKAALLSGVLASINGKMQIFRSSEFKLTPAVTEGIQAGPFLIDGNDPVSGLQGTRIARRTIALTDGKNRGALAILMDPVTLEDAAKILNSPGVITEFKISRALNLDGGKSSGIWVKTTPPYYSREFSEVRNFVGIVASP